MKVHVNAASASSVHFIVVTPVIGLSFLRHQETEPFTDALQDLSESDRQMTR